MPCIDNSVNGLFCKYHEGLIYKDDFTSPLAGRWDVLHDYDGPGVDDGKWQIRVGEGYSGWSLDGTNCLRVRHNVLQSTELMRIKNSEFPDLYVSDAAGRDRPWITVRQDARGVVDPDQFPYDLAYGGIMHRIHDNDSKWLSAIHTHQCGLFSTWVHCYLWEETSYKEESGLINLCDNWWYMKHHVDDDYLRFDQGWTTGKWVSQSDLWEPTIFPHNGINGNLGLITTHCPSWSVDGFVSFHGLRVCETNYIEIHGIPENPDGAGIENLPASPYPPGQWFFIITMPGEPWSSAGRTYRTESDHILSFLSDIYGWHSIQWWEAPELGNPFMIDEIFPSEGVNGGDVYWFNAANEPPPDWPPVNGGGNGVSVQGGCADYEQIWLHAPVLNDFESNFVPGDSHQYVRQIKGFGALTIVGDVTLAISRYRGEDPVIIEKTSTPFDNGDGSYDISITLSPTETTTIGDRDAFQFQLQMTLDDGSVVTPNAGIIKGVPYKVVV